MERSRSKSQSDRSRLFKKTHDCVEKRALRAHRRSVDWKSSRDDQQNKRRNLSDGEDLQLVKEARESDIGVFVVVDPVPCKKGRTANQTAEPPIKNDRRAQLLLWQQKRKEKQMLEKKAAVFKVKSFNPKDYGLDQMKPVKPARPATRSRARPVEREAAPANTGRVTRSRAAVKTPVKPSVATHGTKKAPVRPVAAKKAPVKPSVATHGTKKAPVRPVAAKKAPVKPSVATHGTKKASVRPDDGLTLGYTNSTDFTFELKPLSPKSPANFFGMTSDNRMCSTPKSGNISSAIQVPVVSAIATAPSSAASDESRGPAMALAEVLKHTQGQMTVSEGKDLVGQASEESLEPIEEEDVAKHPINDEIIPMNNSADLLNENTFRTPRSVTKEAWRRAVSTICKLSQERSRTPKALRCSFILQHLSPEERVQVLRRSPMIEMDRRKSKAVSPHQPVSPMPSFDDIDDYMPEEAVEKTEDVSDNHGTVDAVVEKDLPVDAVTEKHDVPYFRAVLVSQTERLNTRCTSWESVAKTESLTEEDQGEVRTAIGKSNLLVAQRFKQFSGLVDNCEFNTGEKETTCEDLAGFWDMVFCQVEDIDSMFDVLEKLQANGWKREKPVQKKKILVKKPAAAKPKRLGKSKFGNFLAEKKKREAEQQNESPNKKPEESCKKETPARRRSMRRSRGLTPAGLTPLRHSLHVRKARRSSRANSIPRQTRRASEAMDNETRRLSSSEQTIRSRQAVDTSKPLTLTTQEATDEVVMTVSSPKPAMTETSSKETENSILYLLNPTPNFEIPESMSPLGVPSTSILFTPDSCVRRSSRRSVAQNRPMEATPQAAEPTPLVDNFEQYLLPTASSHTEEETPARCRSMRSRGLTPAGLTPLRHSLHVRKARRSSRANSIPRQTRRASEAMDNETRRLSSSEQTIRSRQAVDTSKPLTLTTQEATDEVVMTVSSPKPAMTETSSKETENSILYLLNPTPNFEIPESMSPLGVPSTSILFTPDSCVRRSSRRSVAQNRPMEATPQAAEPTPLVDNFEQYLLPTASSHTEEPNEMELGSPPIEDVDMGARMKRDLTSEFDLHADSAKKRASSRRTPPNRDHLGAYPRRSRRQSQIQKENVGTPLASDVETPSTKLARLRVKPSSPETLDERSIDLMSFSPRIPMQSLIASNTVSGEPVGRRRRTSRLGLL